MQESPISLLFAGRCPTKGTQAVQIYCPITKEDQSGLLCLLWSDINHLFALTVGGHRAEGLVRLHVESEWLYLVEEMLTLMLSPAGFSLKRWLVGLLWFYVGLCTVVLGYALVITPALGAAPWDIFHLGLSRQTGLPLFLVLQMTGAVLILLNLALGIRPTVGMVLNMISVGPILQFYLSFMSTPESVVARIAMFVAGIFLAGLGTALYVSAGIGSGPRDGMMIGLTRRIGLPVSIVKNVIDVTVASGGWLLGGPLGVGTVVVALGLGPSIQIGMALVARLSTLSPFSTFVYPVSLKQPTLQQAEPVPLAGGFRSR